MKDPSGNKSTAASILGSIFMMTFPIIVNIFMDEFDYQVNIRYAGRLNNDAMITGLGQAYSLLIVLPYTITFGVSSVLETQVSQAFGSNHLHLCGKYLNQHLFVISAVYVPVCILLFNSKSFLLAFGMDAEVSEYCQKYLRVVLPGMFFDMIILSLTIFLTALERTFVPMMM